MKKHHFSYFEVLFFFFLVVPVSFGQLSPSETRILLRLNRMLEYPSVLHGWTNVTNFCYMPSTVTVNVTCYGNHITELAIIGSVKEKLSNRFSIDSFVTTLTKLSYLKVLSLGSLGLWGTLPSKIKRLESLEVLNVSSNFIYSEIPLEVTSFKSLKSLGLADNMFNGSVPDLITLEKLEIFDVSNNMLGPKFPSLGKNIVSVMLKKNMFRAVIPQEIGNFNQLQHFDVSSNGLFGPIPSSLFGLPWIEYINLAGNKLGGTLAGNTSCGVRLKFVDISLNRLVGKLPSCVSCNSTDHVVIYSWNCLLAVDLSEQHPSSFCLEKAFAVKPPILAGNKKSSSKLGLIVGVVGAVLGGISVLGLLIFVVFRKLGARNADDTKVDLSVMGESFLRLSPKLDPTATMSFGSLEPPPYHIFSYEEIEEITNYFDLSKLMGEGSQGQLYKGHLGGSIVVVRRVNLNQRHVSQAFLQNVEILSKLRHRHLVSLVGHCLNPHQEYSNAIGTIFLVFEYVPNGTLKNHLSDRRKREMLQWNERVAMTIGVARGLQYLHTGITPAILRNNLKIDNVLLDEHFTPKITSYNLPITFTVGSGSPFAGVETNSHPNGHNVFPIHDCSYEDGEKDDVYHLGVILMEVLTGKPIKTQAELNQQRRQLETCLVESPSNLRDLVDPSIRATCAYESLRITVEVTIKCLSKDFTQRPTVEDVLWNLKYSIQVQDGWTPSSEIHSAVL